MQQRPTKTARRLLAAVAALTAATVASSASFAQCTERFPGITVTGGGGALPVGIAFPLGTGSALGALTGTLNSINTAFLTTNSAFVTGGSGVAASSRA